MKRHAVRGIVVAPLQPPPRSQVDRTKVFLDRVNFLMEEDQEAQGIVRGMATIKQEVAGYTVLEVEDMVLRGVLAYPPTRYSRFPPNRAVLTRAVPLLSVPL